MHSTIRMFLVLLALTFTNNFASANDGNQADQIDQNQEVLADILSPDELVTEMGLQDNASNILSTMQLVNIPVRLQIKIDKSHQGTSATAQTMEIYLDGNLINTILVSTGRQKDEIAKSGRAYFSSTPTGTFKIYRRSRLHYSETWKAPMPFAQFFNGGVAIHATGKEHYAELGSRASGGCVRVSYENAEMIWKLVDEVGVEATRITVFDNGL